MKSIIACCLSLTIIFVASESMAEMSIYFAGENEPIYGTWINMDYHGTPAQVLIYNPDGTGAASNSVHLDPLWKMRYLITAKGVDPVGNIMYKIHWIGKWTWQPEGFTLCKISNSGNTLEYVSYPDKYPSKIDPKNNLYRKYTRK